MANRHPARIDRAALDRVLKRATELQAGGHQIGDEGLTEDEVLSLGHEVGIPEAQLRQALLEERVRPQPPGAPTLLDRLVGPSEFITARVVPGEEDAIRATLIRWMEEREHLIPQRSAPGRVVFEQMSSIAGAMRRMTSVLHPTRGNPYLATVELLTAVITPLEPGYCHVTLMATQRARRLAYVAGGGGAMASVGGAAALILGVLGAPLVFPLATVAVAGAAGLGIAKLYRPTATRTAIGLERVLDELERGPSRPLLESRNSRSAELGRDVGDAVREFTREVRKALDK